MTSPNGSPVFIELGQRPDEPGPPIGGARSLSGRRDSRDWRPTPARSSPAIRGRRSALLPLLHLVQSEDGYLTPAGMAFCAAQLGLTGAEVTAVATFYSMYRRSPTGEYLVGVCTNTLCAIMGGDAILDAPAGPPRRPRRRDHRRRQGHPRTHRVQRRMRLRARRDGQLGVLRQPDTVVGKGTRRRTARRPTARARAAARRCAPSGRPPASWRDCPTTARITADGAGPRAPPWPGCASPTNSAWRHRPHLRITRLTWHLRLP